MFLRIESDDPDMLNGLADQRTLEAAAQAFAQRGKMLAAE
jgi:hypothetical protein